MGIFFSPPERLGKYFSTSIFACTHIHSTHIQQRSSEEQEKTTNQMWWYLGQLKCCSPHTEFKQSPLPYPQFLLKSLYLGKSVTVNAKKLALELQQWKARPGYLTITANRLFTFLTGVGVQALIAFDAVGTLLSQDVLLAKKGLFAVVAVKAFRHFDIWASAGLLTVRKQAVSGYSISRENWQVVLAKHAIDPVLLFVYL